MAKPRTRSTDRRRASRTSEPAGGGRRSRGVSKGPSGSAAAAATDSSAVNAREHNRIWALRNASVADTASTAISAATRSSRVTRSSAGSEERRGTASTGDPMDLDTPVVSTAGTKKRTASRPASRRAAADPTFRPPTHHDSSDNDLDASLTGEDKKQRVSEFTQRMEAHDEYGAELRKVRAAVAETAMRGGGDAPPRRMRVDKRDYDLAVQTGVWMAEQRSKAAKGGQAAGAARLGEFA